MYVILYGSVSVILKEVNDFCENERALVCLYDGHHFGEMGLIFFRGYNFY